MTGKPSIQQQNVACLDYSVANKGHLTAYRWDSEDKEISDNKYHQLSSIYSAKI
jgi:hypothetical protein